MHCRGTKTGANDLASAQYLTCSTKATNLQEQYACIDAATVNITHCATTLLDTFTQQFPQTLIMQCGYDLPCLEGKCAGTVARTDPFCGKNATCQNLGTLHWQGPLLQPLAAKYKQYTGLNILGTMQKAAVGRGLKCPRV